VVITSSGGVKIIGLGTLVALHDDFEIEDAELEDTVAFGRLLYACLTARWPGDDCPSLPSAPVGQGRLLLPRQVRAGVPRALDVICDRILNRPARYGAPITTAADVKGQLAQILGNDLPAAAGGMTVAAPIHPAMSASADAPPALLPLEVGGLPSGDDAPVTPGGSSAKRRSPVSKTLTWGVVAVLVLGVALLAYLVGQQLTGRNQRDKALSPSSSPSTSQGTSPVTTRPLQIVTARSFDPDPGSGDENPDLVPLAYDGDPSTAWETLRYDGNPALGGLKDGVGLLLDLGRVHDVQRVTVALRGGGTAVELRAAPPTATIAPIHSAEDYRLLDTVAAAGSSAAFELRQPALTRYVLVWLTSLPPESEDSYRGGVAEVKVYG
jgi:putative peptidoglycan lipid II flippase